MRKKNAGPDNRAPDSPNEPEMTLAMHMGGYARWLQDAIDGICAQPEILSDYKERGWIAEDGTPDYELFEAFYADVASRGACTVDAVGHIVEFAVILPSRTQRIWYAKTRRRRDKTGPKGPMPAGFMDRIRGIGETSKPLTQAERKRAQRRTVEDLRALGAGPEGAPA